jgi:hypothetical protein
MSTRAGYGRGYYGERQLAQDPGRRRGSGWIKIALLVGAGAVIWFMWPRNSPPDYAPGSGPGPGPEDDERSPLPPSPSPGAQTTLPPQLPQLAPLQLSQGAEFRGSPAQAQAVEHRSFPSQQAYEDAVVASARQLQATGAKVVMAPHLAHLAHRLAP